MLIIGCRFHTRYRQIAMDNDESGELLIERRLAGVASLKTFLGGFDMSQRHLPACIEAEIQGERATLLVDTGAVLTAFSQQKIPHRARSFEDQDRRGTRKRRRTTPRSSVFVGRISLAIFLSLQCFLRTDRGRPWKLSVICDR